MTSVWDYCAWKAAAVRSKLSFPTHRACLPVRRAVKRKKTAAGYCGIKKVGWLCAHECVNVCMCLAKFGQTSIYS